jgi:hypothetical protein
MASACKGARVQLGMYVPSPPLCAGKSPAKCAIGAPVDRRSGPTQRTPVVAGIPPPWQCNVGWQERATIISGAHKLASTIVARSCRRLGSNIYSDQLADGQFSRRFAKSYCSRPQAAAAWVCTIGPRRRLNHALQPLPHDTMEGQMQCSLDPDDDAC